MLEEEEFMFPIVSSLSVAQVATVEVVVRFAAYT